MLKMLNKKMNSKGFTLIELLVVISIIGILSSVVMVSLNDARNKARDAAVKLVLSEIRSVAELCYNDNGDYEGCDISNSVTNIKTNNGGGDVTGSINVAQTQINTADAYCLISPLVGSGAHWCVDSDGMSKDIGAAVGCTLDDVCP